MTRFHCKDCVYYSTIDGDDKHGECRYDNPDLAVVGDEISRIYPVVECLEEGCGRGQVNPVVVFDNGKLLIKEHYIN